MGSEQEIQDMQEKQENQEIRLNEDCPETAPPPPKRSRGRPKGSKNKTRVDTNIPSVSIEAPEELEAPEEAEAPEDARAPPPPALAGAKGGRRRAPRVTRAKQPPAPLPSPRPVTPERRACPSTCSGTGTSVTRNICTYDRSV